MSFPYDEGEKLVEFFDDVDYYWMSLSVWMRNRDSRLFIAEDYGCSCNGPMDDFRGWEDLTPLTSITQLQKALADFYPKIPHNERADALRKILPYLEAR